MKNGIISKILHRILTMNYILFLICIITLIVVFRSVSQNDASNCEEIKHEYNLDLNKGYDTDDIPDIEKVRDLFTCYLSSMNYSNFSRFAFDLIDASYEFSDSITITQNLLSKYTKIKIDNKNILTFDENSRYIIIKNGPCIFDTNISIDIPINSFYYLFRESFVPTTNGTWCVYPNALENEFLFFSFGKQYKSRTIKSEHGGLTMLDKRYINNNYHTNDIDRPYEECSKFYLFRSTDGELFIYSVENKKWKSILDCVREVKITNDFVFLIDVHNKFSMYCVEHCKLLYAKFTWPTLDQELNSDADDYLNNVLLKHKKCSD